jgi:hypothetical protein
MLRGRTAGIAAALAIAAVAAVTAGCGGGRSSAVALDPVAAAATKTQNAGVAKMRLHIALKTPQSRGTTIHVEGTGAIDGTNSELSLGLGRLLLQGGAGLPLGIPSSELRHATVKEIAVEQNGDYVVYLSLGPLSSQLPGGKQWIELDLSKLGKSAGLDLSKLMSGAQFQPGDLLSMAKSEGAKVHKVGPATIDGTATTHYRVSIDPATALKASGLASPSLAGAAGQMKTVTENVWIGKDGLLRRIQSSYAADKSHFALTMDLYDYGAHVAIAAPPSSATYDITQLAQGLGSLS